MTRNIMVTIEDKFLKRSRKMGFDYIVFGNKGVDGLVRRVVFYEGNNPQEAMEAYKQNRSQCYFIALEERSDIMPSEKK